VGKSHFTNSKTKRKHFFYDKVNGKISNFKLQGGFAAPADAHAPGCHCVPEGTVFRSEDAIAPHGLSVCCVLLDTVVDQPQPFTNSSSDSSFLAVFAKTHTCKL